MEGRCRLCAEPSQEHIQIIEDAGFCSKIFHLFQIKISDSDSLPSTICQDCYVNVNKTWYFNDRVQKAQEILAELSRISAINIIPTTNNLDTFELEPKFICKSQSPIQELDYINDDSDSKKITKVNYLLNESDMTDDSGKSEEKYLKPKNKKKKNGKCKMVLSQNTHTSFSWNENGGSKLNAEVGWNAYPWSCCECAMVFNNPDSLNQHFVSHHDSTIRYLCADCPKIYSKRSTFLTHVRTHRPRLKNCCDICYKWFPTATEQLDHKLEHNNDKQHICRTCGKRFRMHSALMVHLRSHLPAELKNKFQCDQCPKKFGTKPNLLAHKRIHTGIRDYTCDQCGKSFVQKGNLDNHLLTHIAARPFSCESCGKSFKTLVRLKKHGSVHSGLKPHRCDVCGKEFRERSTLNEHIRIHTGAMPFSCEFCGKCFRFKGVLTTHRRQHTGERPYSCNECQHHFTNWPNYNKHMKRRHGINTSVTCRTRQDIPPTGMPHRNPPGTVLAPPQLDTIQQDPFSESTSQVFYPVLNLYNIPDDLLQTRV